MDGYTANERFTGECDEPEDLDEDWCRLSLAEKLAWEYLKECEAEALRANEAWEAACTAKREYEEAK